jgi:Family of unknown function (DUF6527)
VIERLRPQLVTTIPASPAAGVLYVSVEYATTLHLCACGCGHEVVLGISPHDWTVWWDGHTVTLSPSVGNWSFPCQSHYFIRNNRIVLAGRWNDVQIARGRARDAARHVRTATATATAAAPRASDAQASHGRNLLRRLIGYLTSR